MTKLLYKPLYILYNKTSLQQETYIQKKTPNNKRHSCNKKHLYNKNLYTIYTTNLNTKMCPASHRPTDGWKLCPLSDSGGEMDSLEIYVEFII